MLGCFIIIVLFKIDEDDFMEYFIDFIDINDNFGKLVDIVIDGGIGGVEGFIVIDCMIELLELIC